MQARSSVVGMVAAMNATLTVQPHAIVKSATVVVMRTLDTAEGKCLLSNHAAADDLDDEGEKHGP
jgi:hypothetical protein